MCKQILGHCEIQVVRKKIIIIFSPDFALAHVQKLYTDFLASQLESNKAKAEEVVQDFEKAIGKKWP